MADSSNRLAGTATLTADGQSYALMGEFGYRVSGVTRESLSGADGVHGYKETPRPGQIVASLRDGNAVSMAQINAMTNVTVVMQLANGKTIIGRNMWTVDDQDVKSSEASTDVKWEGLDVSEN
jgi:hypothetical protein